MLFAALFLSLSIASIADTTSGTVSDTMPATDSSRRYARLAYEAIRRGDDQGAATLMARAVQFKPGDPDLAMAYAKFLIHADPKNYLARTIAIANKFPGNPKIATGLTGVASYADHVADRITLYEYVRTHFPRQFVTQTSIVLFYAYASTGQPAKALALGREMVAHLSRGDSSSAQKTQWQEMVNVEDAMMRATALVRERKGAEALAVLAPFRRQAAFRLAFPQLQAAALDAMGQTQAAYDSLLIQVVKRPTDTLMADVTRYGAKLGKHPKDFMADRVQARARVAQPAPPFTGQSFTDKAPISLATYKGKIVLLNFWFPSCDPCRAELPYFQRVMEKYGARGFTILAPNIAADQDHDVMAIMKPYAMVPVQLAEAHKNPGYKMAAAPMNFLIDGKGRIVLDGFRVDNPDTQRTLELLLEHLWEEQAF